MKNRVLIKDITNKVGEKVLINGWAQNIRLLGKIAFVEIRDRSGVVQSVAYLPNFEGDGGNAIKELTQESVVEINGEVKLRSEKQINNDDILGKYEIEINDLKILNKASALPIPVIGDGYDINEESRLKYRYLDLRRDRLSKVLRLRSNFLKAIRDSLFEMDFVEVETPILTSSTKEGARDFVVPSRMNPGRFYALPQSPQQYKQLLMTAGVENYFQIAKCVRDENLRADRGFEFSQIDIETSFRSQEEVRNLVETMLINSISKVSQKLKQGPFPVLTYQEVMEKFGDDKFDIRTDEEKKEGILAFAWVTKYPMFKKIDSEDPAEVEDGKSGWTFTHNPFSGVIEEHHEWLRKGENIEMIEATQYDLVCNGYEIGSGSIRNFDPKLLMSTYRIMGYSDDEIQKSIGHMLKAFELGTPPHGGIGLGIERLIMLLSDEKSLKETIAFPMTYQGRVAVMDGPSELSKSQLEDLHLKIV